MHHFWQSRQCIFMIARHYERPCLRIVMMHVREGAWHWLKTRGGEGWVKFHDVNSIQILLTVLKLHLWVCTTTLQTGMCILFLMLPLWELANQFLEEEEGLLLSLQRRLLTTSNSPVTAFQRGDIYLLIALFVVCSGNLLVKWTKWIKCKVISLQKINLQPTEPEESFE